jgi:hypothetical protein
VGTVTTLLGHCESSAGQSEGTVMALQGQCEGTARALRGHCGVTVRALGVL